MIFTNLILRYYSPIIFSVAAARVPDDFYLIMYKSNKKK